MPFELGLAVAQSFSKGSRHKFFIFEAEPYRLQRSTSDLNGYDPHIHKGTIAGVIECVYNAIGPAAGQSPPPLLTLRALARDLAKYVRAQKLLGGGTFYSRVSYKNLVAAAMQLASYRGLLPKT